MHTARKVKVNIPSVAVLVVLLFVFGTAAYANVTASPTAVNFGNQTVGTASAPVKVIVTNTGQGRVKIGNASLTTTQFSYSGPSLPVTLNRNQSLTGYVTFYPSAVQAYNGTLIFTCGHGSTVQISLSGAGVQTQATPLPPTITTQPASQTVTAGQTATFTVAATGTAPLTYQWKKNGTAISGATSTSYTTPATTSSDNGAQFTVTVTNSAGNVTSSAATLTVNVAPSITTQPASRTVTAGQTATFTVAATGTAPLTYQWKKNGTAISGATSTSYTTPATISSDNGAQFTVTVTNSAGNVTSSAATLTVNVAPSITTQPASQTVIAGQTATFMVGATGTAPLAYQWQKNGTAISGATSSTYTTPATTASDNTTQFTVVVTNSAGSATSNAATLTVNASSTLLNASSTTLSFGSVAVSSSSTQSVTLTNAGNSNATISNVSISGAGFNASGVSTGLILTPGQTAALSVTFAPAATGSVTGSVTVTSNATNSPLTIALSGTGATQVTHSAALSWAADTSVVVGYNSYSSTVSGGPYVKLNSTLIPTTIYTDTTVQSGKTYYYVVTAVDSNNFESTFSNQTSATIP